MSFIAVVPKFFGTGDRFRVRQFSTDWCGTGGFRMIQAHPIRWALYFYWRRNWQPTPVSILAWKIPWTEEPGEL